MSRSSKARYAVLGMLSLGPASGYEIKRMMERSTDGFWREGDGSIYPILKQLLKEERVTVTIGNADSDKPKKIYSITGKGRGDLADWLSATPESFQSRNELLLKVFFGWNVESQVIIRHIEKAQQEIIQKLVQSQAAKDQYFSGELSRDKSFQLFTLKYAIAHMQVSIDWCDEVLRALKSGTIVS